MSLADGKKQSRRLDDTEAVRESGIWVELLVRVELPGILTSTAL
jgi:hypothetical protein